MSRAGSDYQFVSESSTAIEESVTQAYTAITGQGVRNASPEKLFIKWVTAMLVQAYASINIAGNQNIPSRAEGQNLDALGELFYASTRPQATAAGVQMEFTISTEQTSVVLVPAGTRVTTDDGAVNFSTDEDAFIPIGETTVIVHCTCDTVGVVGNGYAIGEITKCVDVFPYYASCVNVDESDGGSDTATDEEYYALMVASLAAYSCAGAEDAYMYFAKSVSTDIEDVLVNSPTPGEVRIYVLMNTGAAAGTEIKNLVYAACSAKEHRPMTDLVLVSDPDTVSYDIDITFYIANNATSSASDIASAVNDAVNNFVSWQAGKLGRDINPSTLIRMIMAVNGVKRVEVVSPEFTVLRDGTDISTLALSVPQLAEVNTISITNGGYENE